jgi:hypothetical protein
MESIVVSHPLLAEDIGLRQFRAALSKRDCETFDTLMERVDLHEFAIMNSTRLKPHDSRILSILIEQEKRLEKLYQQINSSTRG